MVQLLQPYRFAAGGAPPPTSVDAINEPFTYSNGRLQTVGTNWTDSNSAVQVVSNRVEMAAASTAAYAFYTIPLSLADIQVVAQVTPGDGDYAGVGVVVRGNGNSASPTGYRIEVGNWSPGTNIGITRLDGGSSTEVHTAAVGASTTATMELEVIVSGTTIEVYIDGSLVTTYAGASSYTSQRHVGLYFGRYGGDVPAIDGLVAGAIETGVLAEDNFNRANSDSDTQLGPNWIKSSPHGWPYMTITNNEAVGTNVFESSWYWHEPASSTDQYAEVDAWGSEGECGLMICHSGILTDYNDAYIMRWTNWYHVVWLIKNGTQVAEWGNISNPAAFQRFRLEREGNVIRGYYNGVLLGSYTDATPLTGLYFGIDGGGLNNGPPRYDNFEGGDL